MAEVSLEELNAKTVISELFQHFQSTLNLVPMRLLSVYYICIIRPILELMLFKTTLTVNFNVIIYVISSVTNLVLPISCIYFEDLYISLAKIN